eukprot:87_1
MGTCFCGSSQPDIAKQKSPPLVGNGKNTCSPIGEPEEEFRRTSRLIPYSDDDPLDVKIKKIHFRWRMNRRNLINYMNMLKFDSILQFSIANHLPPHDNATEYLTIDDLLGTLYQNGVQKSIFCQYWKMDKYISSRAIIEHHLQYVFTFKQWKVDEQLSYVNESDLMLFEPYNPVVNTKTIIKDYMSKGDILVVLTPRWHEPAARTNQKHSKQESTLEVESVIKVHSFTPFSYSGPDLNSKTNMISRDSSIKTPFHFKMFQPKPHENTASGDQSRTVSPYNVINSDFEDASHSHHELIPIKLTDFQKYITMQAMCTAVTVTEAELVTSKAHEKLKTATSNEIGGVLDAMHQMNNGFEMPLQKPRKKLTDLAEDSIAETSVIHHDSKPKYNRFYFTLCMDRTSALLKVQELVIQINEIIDDLSFLYSIVVEASLANLSASQYIHSMREKGAEHLLSLHSMSAPSFINICGGLAKYWNDIDKQRSILKRVQSALQFSALGFVFMYPKDYAARTKWNVGDPVMIFKQDIEKWCPGKIVCVYPREDDIEVKYAILKQQAKMTTVIPPTLAQGDEDAPAKGSIADELNYEYKITFTSNAMSMEENHELFGGGVEEAIHKFDVISAKKYSAIDFDHDTTLCSIKINRYDRVQKPKRGSLSFTIDHKTSELLTERLQDICADVVLCDENVEEKEDKKRYLNTKNVHPISLMFVEIDQLSTKINQDNRPGNNNEYKDDREYNERFIMLRVSIGKHLNQTGSVSSSRISVNEFGKKGNSIRYGNNVFALLLHNTDVAKSLLISRFIQKEIVDLFAATTEFEYESNYLTVSMACANLHYTADNTKIIDSERSWYKRCSDALKTIRYEGGNGVTHADVLFGVSGVSANQREEKQRELHQIGIVNNSQEGIAFESNSFENDFDAFKIEEEEYNDAHSANLTNLKFGSEPTSLQDLNNNAHHRIDLNQQTQRRMKLLHGLQVV